MGSDAERVTFRTYELSVMTRGAGDPDYVLIEALDADPRIRDWKFKYRDQRGNVHEWSK